MECLDGIQYVRVAVRMIEGSIVWSTSSIIRGTLAIDTICSVRSRATDCQAKPMNGRPTLIWKTAPTHMGLRECLMLPNPSHPFTSLYPPPQPGHRRYHRIFLLSSSEAFSRILELLSAVRIVHVNPFPPFLQLG